MSTSSRKTYVIDTNVLIEFSIWIPISLNNYFWSKLEDALKNGEWILLDVVVDEILYMPELKKWCQRQKHAGFVKSITDDNRNRAVEINSLYPMIDKNTAKSTVDTYLIAYAEASGLTIFSRESPRKSVSDVYKIPDTCTALKVDRIARPEPFLTAIGFKN